MTVSGSTYKNTYTLDSSTTVFPYTFKIIQDSDMLVTLYNTSDNTSTTVSSSEYTIVGAGNDTGTRTVTWANAASYGSAYQLILQSNAAYTQPTDYEEGDDFAQETHELALDRLSIQIRQLVELINRTLKLDVSTTTASSIADNAGYLYSDGSGNLSFGTPSGVSDTLPALSTGDSGKALRVNGDEDAFELYDLPYDSDNNGTFANFSAVNIDASGNVTVDGALAVTGATSLASLNLATGSTITSILDEDLMTSNSATALATQQSIKAYVDSKGFGAYETTDASQVGGTAAALAFETTYTAEVDGFVFGYVNVSAGANINIYLNGTIVKKTGGAIEGEFDLTVAAGDTWKITSQGTENESNLMFRPRS